VIRLRCLATALPPRFLDRETPVFAFAVPWTPFPLKLFSASSSSFLLPLDVRTLRLYLAASHHAHVRVPPSSVFCLPRFIVRFTSFLLITLSGSYRRCVSAISLSHLWSLLLIIIINYFFSCSSTALLLVCLLTIIVTPILL